LLHAANQNWIEMFKGESFSDVAPTTKDKIPTSVENKLRPTLFREGSWYPDYRRLRIVAFKS